MTTRIFLADDQADIRMGFRRILEAETDLQVVGEADNGIAALMAIRSLEPEVLLADIRMPEMDGLELTREITRSMPAVRVVVVTTFDLDEYVHTALREGACGFLLKRSRSAVLVEAVRAAAAGDSMISPEVTTRLLNRFRRERRAVRRPDEPMTSREEEVARLVAEGLTNSEIGAELFISAGTVKTHLARLQKKLGVRNRVGIAAWVWESGLMAQK
ncbi:DNA-binding response regulator, NarL/FixJ family, contains REC and HTH domains [Streptomyces qinglanensis]|uniref:DNA-binding response regulator, NarL/FixJ family, contains REC and HTH domains n=2 Tax=Streptomyces qinglanensis TaxID=943816 RepID=A0A1H9W5R2_9ACTN|nr:DNA-binding response regulator, NarL/FixJ family, contains REC and HTH domains [Streptomyces qinglanensis]